MILKNKLFIYLFLLQLCTQFVGILCISSGANEPIPDNELQLTAKDCSLQYCADKDGMALWLSLQNICVKENANPYFLEIDHQTYYQQNNVLSPFVTGSICASISLISFLMGYLISQQEVKKNKYSELKMIEDE